MRQQRLLQVSYSDKDAKLALKLMIPSMESGFNVDTLHGYLSVDGEDAQALAALLTERIASRRGSRGRRRARRDGRNARTLAVSQSHSWTHDK
jgi:hypothetical protein